MEKQFFTRPIKLALARTKKKHGNYPLSVIEDCRIKPNKYSRIVKMEPEYASGNVFTTLIMKMILIWWKEICW